LGVFVAVLAEMGVFAIARQNSPISESSVLQTGVVTPKVICIGKPDQSYAVYLPSNYSADRKWPILYAFDPAARGVYPLERMKDAAERLGYIVVGSNNSRNGSWKMESEAAQAMFDDTHVRLAIDVRRLYFAGFSGGARLASVIAQKCKCAAGVLLNGAGFSPGMPPSRDSAFPVFAGVGIFDFNYGEMSQLQDQLEAQHFPHALRSFDGAHEWAPSPVMQEAFDWFRVIAIKKGLEPPDDAFVAAQAQQSLDRARDLEHKGELFAAWREYHQAAEEFDVFPAATSLRKGATSLESEKVVRDGAKRERQEIEEQSQLTQEISAGMAALHNNGGARTDLRSDLERKIAILRDRSTREKRPEKQRVLRRALGGLLVQAIEGGEQPFEAKDFALARDYFQLAVAADPASVWALENLAVAQAQTGDHKAAIESLRRAREAAKDRAAFFAWVAKEESFAKLRQEAQFRALLN
jgi:tetratricopeptide (TPR) repeat protein